MYNNELRHTIEPDLPPPEVAGGDTPADPTVLTEAVGADLPMDPAARFAELQHMIAASLRRRLPGISAADVEDAVSETLLRAAAVTSGEFLEYPGKAHEWSWLGRIATNLRIDAHRVQLRIDLGGDVQLADRQQTVFDDPEAHAVKADELARLTRALQQLPERLRILMRDHYLHGMTVAGLAKLYDTPEGTVKRRLYDGRALLRKAMEDRRNV